MNANKFWWEYVWTTSFVYCFIFLRSSGIYCYELNMWKKTSLLTGLVCVQRQIRALYYLKIWNFWEGSIFQDKFWMQVKAASHQNVFWNIFFKICWQYPTKASFEYQQWTATVHIFLKVPDIYRFIGLLFKTFSKTQSSVIVCNF